MTLEEVSIPYRYGTTKALQEPSPEGAESVNSL
mgnify:CR=1 FL=1